MGEVIRAPFNLGDVKVYRPRTPRLIRLLAGLCLVIASLAGSPTHAAPVQTVAQGIRGYYHHDSWTAKDGAPAGIWTITQTSDGWIWLGCNDGLFRFDGETFERIDLRPADSTLSRSVGEVFAARNGDLWVAFGHGGAALLRGGDPHRVELPEGLPPSQRTEKFEQDGDGRMWAQTSSGRLLLLEKGHWDTPEAAWNIPADPGNMFTTDSRGTFWYGVAGKVYFLRKGARRFELARLDIGPDDDIDRTQDGHLWLSTAHGASAMASPDALPFDAQAGLVTAPHGATQVIARDGSFWSTFCPKGICRSAGPALDQHSTPAPVKRDIFSRTSGLSSDNPMTIFEDREGGIWIGTRGGLDHFRRNDVVAVDLPNNVINFAMAADAAGSIWSGTSSDDPSITDRWWQLDPAPHSVPGFSGAVGVAFADVDGTVLMGGEGVPSQRFGRGHFSPLDLPAHANGERVIAFARDGEKHLWVSLHDAGLFRLDDAIWVKRADMPSFRTVSRGPWRRIRKALFGWDTTTIICTP